MQFLEHLLFHRGDLILISGHINQVVSLDRIGFQIVKTVVVPRAVIINVLIAIGANGEQRRRGREIPLSVILIKNMVAPGQFLT